MAMCDKETGRLFAAEFMHGERLNLGNRHEIDALCRSLRCRPTDIYTAVAMVGDRLTDVRRYLDKALAANTDSEETPKNQTSSSLPPAWPVSR